MNYVYLIYVWYTKGSPVTEGVKYILRTDVIYESEKLQETLRANRYNVIRAPLAGVVRRG